MPARRHQPHVTSLLLALLALLHLKTDACLCLRVASSRTLDIYLGISACFRTYRTPALTEAVGFSAHARRLQPHVTYHCLFKDIQSNNNEIKK